MPVHLVVEQQLPAPAAIVFARLHDYDRRLEWDTLLRAAHVDRTPIEPGVTGRCTAKWWLGGYSFVFRYVTFEPPTLAAVTLTRPAPFFPRWAASIRHRDHDDATSTITYTMTFACRPRLLEPIARIAFRHETRRRLRALARVVTLR